MNFPENIESDYMVVETKYGNGECERTIPLGSWRKGGGLAGSRGHVYIAGEGAAGVWLIHGQIAKILTDIRALFPSMRTMQVSGGEATFRVPFSDLDRILPLLNAKRQRKATEAVRRTLANARATSPVGKGRRIYRAEKPIPSPESTRTENLAPFSGERTNETN